MIVAVEVGCKSLLDVITMMMILAIQILFPLYHSKQLLKLLTTFSERIQHSRVSTAMAVILVLAEILVISITVFEATVIMETAVVIMVMDTLLDTPDLSMEDTD